MKTNLIHLKYAYLCVNCSYIGESASRCKACDSEALLALEPILNRPATVSKVTEFWLDENGGLNVSVGTRS
jgi:hypothetical protein